jgi:hypothetical protein
MQLHAWTPQLTAGEQLAAQLAELGEALPEHGQIGRAQRRVGVAHVDRVLGVAVADHRRVRVPLART